jgi:hypothetical protein
LRFTQQDKIFRSCKKISDANLAVLIDFDKILSDPVYGLAYKESEMIEATVSSGSIK